jgi:hypothetical protein
MAAPQITSQDATRHVAFGVVERTKGAKGVLFAEMTVAVRVKKWFCWVNLLGVIVILYMLYYYILL